MGFLCSIFKGVCFSIVTFSYKRHLKEMNWHSAASRPEKNNDSEKTGNATDECRGCREKGRGLFRPVAEYGKTL